VKDGQLTLNIIGAVLSAPVGLLLGWIRLRSGSIWPAVLTHNAINSAHLVGAVLV
jgi:membrane protease YdiL (CAAX protease family)